MRIGFPVICNSELLDSHVELRWLRGDVSVIGLNVGGKTLASNDFEKYLEGRSAYTVGVRETGYGNHKYVIDFLRRIDSELINHTLQYYIPSNASFYEGKINTKGPSSRLAILLAFAQQTRTVHPRTSKQIDEKDPLILVSASFKWDVCNHVYIEPLGSNANDLLRKWNQTVTIKARALILHYLDAIVLRKKIQEVDSSFSMISIDSFKADKPTGTPELIYVGPYDVQKVLNGLFLPIGFETSECSTKGIYEIGDRHRLEEEVREEKNIERAIRFGINPENLRVTARRFYSFQRDTAWLGVYRNWDAERSFYPHIISHIHSVFESGNLSKPAAAIVGPGGTGKSIALRRLAIELKKEIECSVWFVDEPGKFNREEALKLMGEDSVIYLLIDKIGRVEVSWWKELHYFLEERPNIVLIVAGREMPRFVIREMTDKSIYHPSIQEDRRSILNKILVEVPEWKDQIEDMLRSRFDKARLIAMLVVLSRHKSEDNIPATEMELKKTFSGILASDIRSLKRKEDYLPGLCNAVIDAAFVCSLGYYLSLEAFVNLARHHIGIHQPGHMNKLDDIRESEKAWEDLSSLVYWERNDDTVRFNHDELAQGILETAQRGEFADHIGVLGDRSWKRSVFRVIMGFDDNDDIKSLLLGGVARLNPTILGKEEILESIGSLLDSSNDHGAYLDLILDDNVEMDWETRLSLMLRTARIIPRRDQFWEHAYHMIRKETEKAQLSEVLQKAYNSGCRSYKILTELIEQHPEGEEYAKECLENETEWPNNVKVYSLRKLGKENKLVRTFIKQKIEVWNKQAFDKKNTALVVACLSMMNDSDSQKFVLENIDNIIEVRDDNETPIELLSTFINILKKHSPAKAAAISKVFLDNPQTPERLQDECIKAIGAEAENYATKKLKEWKEIKDKRFLSHCMRAARKQKISKEISEEVIGNWEQYRDISLRFEAIIASEDTISRTKIVESILKNWRRESRNLVSAAMIACERTPHKARNACRGILNSWEKEIERGKTYKFLHIGHICRALSHPDLNMTSRSEAQNMLKKESEIPGYLPRELREHARYIVEGCPSQWPCTDRITGILHKGQIYEFIIVDKMAEKGTWIARFRNSEHRWCVANSQEIPEEYEPGRRIRAKVVTKDSIKYVMSDIAHADVLEGD